MERETKPLVAVIMGSKSDYEYMAAACETMGELKVPHEVRVLSAHRTPDLTLEYASKARERGFKVIIAGAGGAAHLAGVLAAKTTLPVIGVPMPTTSLNGMDSLLSIVQMPKGVPVATMAIGKAGGQTRDCSRRKSWRFRTRRWPSGLRTGARGARRK